MTHTHILPPSHTHILPPLHPPTLTSSQSRGPQLNVIPLALRWYSSSGGSTRIISNFDPREDPKVTVEVHRLRSSSLNRLVLQREIRRSLLQCKQKSKYKLVVRKMYCRVGNFVDKIFAIFVVGLVPWKYYSRNNHCFTACMCTSAT